MLTRYLKRAAQLELASASCLLQGASYATLSQTSAKRLTAILSNDASRPTGASSTESPSQAAPGVAGKSASRIPVARKRKSNILVVGHRHTGKSSLLNSCMRVLLGDWDPIMAMFALSGSAPVGGGGGYCTGILVEDIIIMVCTVMSRDVCEWF